MSTDRRGVDVSDRRSVAMWAGVSLIVASALVGCGQSVSGSAGVARDSSEPARATDTVTPEEADPIGAPQNVADGRRVVTRVTVDSLTFAQPAQYGLSPSGSLQQITVTLEGLKGTTNVNPLYFTARATDGTTYQVALGSVDNELPAGTVSVGDRIKGVVAFDVTGPPIASIRYNGALGEELARWVGQVAPGSAPPSGSDPDVGDIRGDLGLTVPVTIPPCDGTGIVVLYSATAPGSYEQEVSTQLSLNPGAQYLRTDNSCPSLRQQTAEGNPVYAVYRVAGRTESEVCAAVGAAGGGAYGKWLDQSTDPSYIIPC